MAARPLVRGAGRLTNGHTNGHTRENWKQRLWWNILLKIKIYQINKRFRNWRQISLMEDIVKWPKLNKIVFNSNFLVREMIWILLNWSQQSNLTSSTNNINILSLRYCPNLFFGYNFSLQTFDKVWYLICLRFCENLSRVRGGTDTNHLEIIHT